MFGHILTASLKLHWSNTSTQPYILSHFTACCPFPHSTQGVAFKRYWNDSAFSFGRTSVAFCPHWWSILSFAQIVRSAPVRPWKADMSCLMSDLLRILTSRVAKANYARFLHLYDSVQNLSWTSLHLSAYYKHIHDSIFWTKTQVWLIGFLFAHSWRLRRRRFQGGLGKGGQSIEMHGLHRIYFKYFSQASTLWILKPKKSLFLPC